MTNTPKLNPWRSAGGTAFDRATSSIALAATITFVIMVLLLGPLEAMERLAVITHKVMLLWSQWKPAW